MDMGKARLSIDELLGALTVEIDSPPQLLPPSSIYPALTDLRSEVAEWAQSRLAGTFLPTQEETVAVNKARHGVRPVAVWDIPSRLAYRVLASRLRALLPAQAEERPPWRTFLRTPLEYNCKYIVGSDIAACYENIDHGLLADELVSQTGDHESAEAVCSLLLETGGRAFGLPQQSPASDVLAEAVLDRLERALVRRRLQVIRYNDDFRFMCDSWAEVVRSIEVLSEEARLIGLTINDMKTLTWRRSKYEAQLDTADLIRQEIADEAELDLTLYAEGEYDELLILEPDPDEVDQQAALGVLERWNRVAGRSTVAARRRAEHRAIVEILPLALGTLASLPDTTAETLNLCMRLLRFERTMTPAVGRYLASRNDDEGSVLTAFDRLLRARSYLNGWQTWWLQQPVAQLNNFASGAGSAARIRWARAALTSAENTPVLRGHVALTLARHGEIQVDELLKIYDRCSNAVRPVLVAAIAHLDPPNNVRRSLTGDSELHRWVYESTVSGD